MQPEGPGKKAPTMFSDIYNALKPGLFESGQHVRGEEKGGQLWYYLHGSLMPPSPFDGDASERRAQKYENGAKIVRYALEKEYGKPAVNSVLRSVKTDRNLEKEVTRGDLVLIHQELQKPEYQELRRQHQELQRVQQELQSLRGRLEDDTPQETQNDLVEGWTATIQKYYGRNRDIEGGLNLVADYMQRNTMQFDDETGTLELTQEGGRLYGEDELNKSAALGKFIDRHFGEKEGDPAFQNIASNILAYLPRDTQGLLAKKTGEVARDAASPAGYEPRTTYTLSVKAGNVDVVGDTSVPFARTNYCHILLLHSAADVDYSKYRFVRHERFEISGTNLKSEPRAFNAAANVVPAGRVDTIEFAEGAAPPQP